MPLMRTRPYPQLEPANMRAPWLYEVDGLISLLALVRVRVRVRVRVTNPNPNPNQVDDLIGLIAATPHPNHSGSDGAGTQGWSLLHLQLNVPS